MKIVLTPEEWQRIIACKNFLVNNPNPCEGCGHVDCEACGKKPYWDKKYTDYLIKVPDNAEVHDYMRAMVKIDKITTEMNNLKKELDDALRDVEEKRENFIIEEWECSDDGAMIAWG